MKRSMVSNKVRVSVSKNVRVSVSKKVRVIVELSENLMSAQMMEVPLIYEMYVFVLCYKLRLAFGLDKDRRK